MSSTNITALSPLDMRILDAQGCTLSDEVTAPWDLPPFDNSSMDGYAVDRPTLPGRLSRTPCRCRSWATSLLAMPARLRCLLARPLAS